MQTLTIDPPSAFPLPRTAPVCVALVGCGGTGSHIAQALVRIAVHCRDAGLPPVHLIFIDGDRVEAKNVGRQLFSPAEVGLNKAQALAARFSAAFGIKITALHEMLSGNLSISSIGDQMLGILIGAVDSAAGRLAMHNMMTSRLWKVWIDCGNHERSGQVICGSVGTMRLLQGACAVPGICTALPTAGLIFPELLRPAPARIESAMDCATAMQNNAQSLMVNQMMAAVAAEYAQQLIVERQVSVFQTEVDLATLSMRSTPITVANLARVCDMAEAELRGETSRVRKKKTTVETGVAA